MTRSRRTPAISRREAISKPADFSTGGPLVKELKGGKYFSTRQLKWGEEAIEAKFYKDIVSGPCTNRRRRRVGPRSTGRAAIETDAAV